MRKRKMPFIYHATSLFGRQVRRLDKRFGLADLDESVRDIMRAVAPYTLTPDQRIASLCASVDYVVDHDIPGALLECGLWRGGSLMAILLRLRQRGVCDRDIVGFDTFAGMTEPTHEDVDRNGNVVADQKGWHVYRASNAIVNTLARVANLEVSVGISRDEVFDLLASTGYPAERIRLVAGPVEDTLPAEAPETIALLRLDTDYYVSTRHELEHLYPRVPVGGVLMIDDYGYFQGARKAVDEYLDGQRIFLQRIDHTCRLAIKQACNGALSPAYRRGLLSNSDTP